MDVIVEVHDEVELRRALRLGADIVGINNRDLKSLTTDLAVTERLAPMIPPDVLVISESGVSCRVDVERLRVHADAFLVGSALMDSENIVEAARALLFGRVKLCGLTSEADVRLAAQAGATHAGFIMVPESSRAVTPADIAPLAALARASGLKTVGVFRDAEIGLVAKTAEALQLDAIQLHGSEDPQHYLRRLPESSEIWAVCGVGSTAAPPREGANRSLFDTIRHHASGGTGKAFDWSLIEGRADLSSGFLAGGIGPGNAAQATMVGVYGLDVGSSVEAAPGQKDRVKVEALFAALRPTARGES